MNTTCQKDIIPVYIHWMIEKDMPEVMEIEQLSFGYDGWVQEDFSYYQHYCNSIGLVAEYHEKVVGFMVYELFKKKFRIVNFAVHPDWQRRDVGTQMVAKMVGKLSRRGRTLLTLEVRETNLAAQLFFKAQNFRGIRVLRGFYEYTGEDAFVMEYRHESYFDSEAYKPANRIALFG